MQLIENASKKEVLMMSFEEKMKKELKKNLEIPDVVEQKIQDAYKEIGQGSVTMKKLNICWVLLMNIKKKDNMYPLKQPN